MENGQFNLLLEEIRENRGIVLDLVERVATLEARYGKLSRFWKIVGGFLSAIGVVLLWFVSQ
jgi:hypothetical protein